jgi:UDP-N-acetylmuramyl pentapeptide phosphotransferase/UDP-N-acetylglucosamine-1-phosphate transferase
MGKSVAWFILIASIILLLIGFYDDGLNFDKGRISRNLSSVLLMGLATFTLYNHYKNPKK